MKNHIRPILLGLPSIITALVLGFAASPVRAQVITFDSANFTNTYLYSGSGVLSMTNTWTQTISEGDNAVLVLGTALEQYRLATVTATFDGTPLTVVSNAHAHTNATSYLQTDILYLSLGNIASGGTNGTLQLVYNFSSGFNFNAIISAGAVFYNVDQTTPILAATNNFTSVFGSTLSTPITTTLDDALVLDVFADNRQNHSFTPGASQNEIMDFRWDTVGSETGHSMAMSTRDVSTAGTITNDWTASANWNQATHSLIALQAIPEPSTCLLTAVGLLMVFGVRRRRSK